MKTFDNITDAFEHVVTHLIPDAKCYIVNVSGPRETAKSVSETLQLVAEHMIFGNQEVGLMSVGGNNGGFRE